MGFIWHEIILLKFYGLHLISFSSIMSLRSSEYVFFVYCRDL